MIRRIRLLLVLAIAGGAACAPAEEPAVAEAAGAAADSPAMDTVPARPAVYIGETAQSYSTPGFEHNPHANVGCDNCHSDLPGHSAHGAVSCLQCHGDPGAGTAVNAVSAAECQACHHRADPPRSCARCHADARLGAPQPVTIPMAIAGRTREAKLAFAHGVHDGLECTECHVLPRVTPVRACTACHENHHRADADCTSCHDRAAPGTHDLQVHLGCRGAGCHTEATVTALPMSRPVCLSCHQDRRGHETGRDCAECHLFRDRAVAPMAGPRPPPEAWRSR